MCVTLNKCNTHFKLTSLATWCNVVQSSLIVFTIWLIIDATESYGIFINLKINPGESHKWRYEKQETGK